jgi:uncharacterized protein (TIGR02271 family)
MAIDRTLLRENMLVYSRDGEKLGKIVRLEPSSFIIEKGFFFPKDYVASIQHIEDIRSEDVILSLSKEELQSGASRVAGGDLQAGEREQPELGQPSERIAAASISEETRIPLAEEELVAEKTVREAGGVLIRKDVEVEEKQVSVPVMKEEIRVQRVPAAGESVSAEQATFKEEEVRIPLREEEVEVRKKPVVREEIRVSKTGRQEQRVASEEVRREVADVQEEGEVRRSPSSYEDESLHRR